MSKETIPNALTFLRILLIPVVIASFYIDQPFWRWVAVLAFCSACLTDFLDGYLARMWSQTSKLGQFLDPLADKLLVATTLLFMAGFDKISRISIIPAAVILCREILVSGLRDHMSEMNETLHVTNLAKWKTFAQMGAIGVLLVGDASKIGVAVAGELLLWLAAGLTIATAYDYVKNSLKHF